jgi:murein DD-endopeptidase MepM/ murein hydrolase activator NlpD
MSGTSASAAKAAGMASKVWEANPDLSVTQVIDILTGSAIDLKSPGWDEETGFGVVNLNKAVQVAKDTKPQSYTPSPFLSPTTWGLEGKVTPWERATYDLKTGDFTSIIWSTNGVTLRNSTNLSDKSNLAVGYQETLTFDAWTYGEAVPDLTTNEQDALWFRTNVNGQSYWVPSAYTKGYPPGNPPLLPPTDNPVVQPPTDNPVVQPPTDNPVVQPPTDNPVVQPPTDNPVVQPPTDNPVVQPPTSINLNGYNVGGNFYPVFQNSQSTLGNPISGVINYNGVSYQLFDKGSIVSSANGTFPLYGAIRQEFLKTGGLDGWLGAPKSAEKGQGDGTLIQYFEKGYISWNGVKAIAYKEGTGLPSVSVPPNQPIFGNIGGSHSGGGFTLVSSDGAKFNSIKEYLLYLGKAGLLTDAAMKTYAHYDSFAFFWNEQRWEETINEAKDLAYINGNPSSDIGKLYKDLNTDLFGVDKPFTIGGAYISNEYHQEVIEINRKTLGYPLDLGYHGGIDIAATKDGKGVEVKSLVDGTVVLAGRDENGKPINGDKYGYLTIRDATGTNHIYMHLSKITVKEGKPVKAGETVGVTGATGTNNIHLHYEVGRPGTDPKGEVIGRILTTEDEAKQRLRKVTYNPLENYWEMKYYGPNGKPAPTYI